MNIEQSLKQLIKEAIREIIDEEIQRGRLQPEIRSNPSEVSKPSTTDELLKPRDPNAIVRPGELADILSISRPTLWRWEQSGKLPPKLRFSGRISGWRYKDIVEWLNRQGQQL